jgi:hypothetical protein
MGCNKSCFNFFREESCRYCAQVFINRTSPSKIKDSVEFGDYLEPGYHIYGFVE